MHYETAKLYEGPPCDRCRRIQFIGTCTHRPMKMPELPFMKMSEGDMELVRELFGITHSRFDAPLC